jgi:hypothetical protein
LKKHSARNLRQIKAVTMNLRISRGSLGVVGGVLGGFLSHSAVALAESPPPTQPTAYYVGVGFRGGKGDATAAVLDSKFKLTDLGNLTLSTRPALMTGGYDTEWRLPVTVEGHQNANGVSWFGGGGLAYNMDDLDEIDGMLSGGLDYAVNRRLILNLTINYIWQNAISDDDTEFMATLNYGF